MPRRSYKTDIKINGLKIIEVIIDPHFAVKHSDSITDSIILELVKTLDGGLFEPIEVKNGFQYFVSEPVIHKGKAYRLVWLLEKNHSIYIGVINAFRRQ